MAEDGSRYDEINRRGQSGGDIGTVCHGFCETRISTYRSIGTRLDCCKGGIDDVAEMRMWYGVTKTCR